MRKGGEHTIMTGTKTMRASHGRYVSAGYAQRQAKPEEKDLYIADDPAGSARENLRDLNKTGYRAERPWHDPPDPALQREVPPRQATVKTTVRRTAKKKSLGPVDHLLLEIRRDRAGVTVCVMLAATMLMMAVAWGRNMVSGVNIQRDIENYQAQTISLQRENEKLTQQLENAESGERIRNLAQNELGMLRRERAQTETIYIQAPEKKAQEGAQTGGETHMEILDFLLGLLNVFHIGE